MHGARRSEPAKTPARGHESIYPFRVSRLRSLFPPRRPHWLSFFFPLLSLSLSLSAYSLPPNSPNPSKRNRPFNAFLQVPAKANNNVAAKIAAVAAAVLVSAAPVFAADDAVKNAVCARTPTAKMCLRDSVKR